MVWATETISPCPCSLQKRLCCEEEGMAVVQLAGVRSQRSLSSSGVPALC